MTDLQSTTAMQRYLVVEEGHGILGFFEMPEGECIRDRVRKLMDSRYDYDDCIVFLRDPNAPSGDDCARDKAIFAYAIPDSVPPFDPDEQDFYLDYGWTEDLLGFGDTSQYPRVQAFLRVDMDRRNDGLISIDPFPGNDGEHAIDASGTAREVTARVAAAFPRLDDESCRLLARLARQQHRPAEDSSKGSRDALIDFFWLPA